MSSSAAPVVTMLYDIESRLPRARVKTTNDYHIEVIPMLYNWRVHTLRVNAGPLEWSDRFWCYEGRGWDSYTRAVLAAHAWDGADDTEPVGWIKAWDGRRGERLRLTDSGDALVSLAGDGALRFAEPA